MIEVKHLEKYYGSDGTVTKALDDISFISYDGEFLCIMGASGSGKSTLLNCLSTIDCASAGDILFNGVSFDSLKKFRAGCISVAIISVLFFRTTICWIPLL